MTKQETGTPAEIKLRAGDDLTFGLMSDAQIGALVRAEKSGAVIQMVCDAGDWGLKRGAEWFNDCNYRVKPAGPVAEGS